jgi:hypothetical protein
VGTKLRISRCNGNECRAKDSVANEVPLLEHRDHMAAGNRWAGLATIDHGDGLVAIWVEFLAGWAQGHQAAPLEGLDKLPQGQLHAAILLISSSDRPELALMVILFSLPVALSFAETCKIPLASMSKVTSI